MLAPFIEGMSRAVLAAILLVPFLSIFGGSVWADARLPDVALTEAAIAHYDALSAMSPWPALPDGPSLRPGDADRRVPQLRQRLRITDEGSDWWSPDNLGEIYDPGLERAVRRFQQRNGLVVDGIVGPATRTALNVAPARRAAMLRVNLHRLRQLVPWPARFVLVHVPAFEAFAVENDVVRIRSRAIVGRPTRQTPEFRSAIEEMVFNPFWTVPVKLARRDIAPKAHGDPGYLAEQGIRVYQSWAADAPEIDPAGVDWTALPSTVKLRQDPGPKNALGRVKFLFPNPYDVYLHDTPGRELFARLPRAFSSGCVRLERALDLAQWLLEDYPAWSPDAVRGAADGGARVAVRLRAPVPVIFTYLTAWAGADGVVQFRDDLYGRDRIDPRQVADADPDACHVDDPALSQYDHRDSGPQRDGDRGLLRPEN